LDSKYYQYAPSATALADGSFVITWVSDGQDGSGYVIYAQRYDASGNTAGDEFQVSYHEIYIRDFNPLRTSITALEDGGFVISWNGYYYGDSSGIFAQRYDASGNRVGDEFLVNTYTASEQSYPSTATLADGSFVITWVSDGQDGDGIGVYAQRYDASGNTQGTEFQVNTYTISIQEDQSITALADGGFIITWHSYGQDGSGSGIYAQRYDANGNTQGSEFQVNTYTYANQFAPSTTALADGGFIITWQSNVQDGSGYGIYAQRYDSSGNTVGTEFQVNTYTETDQFIPRSATLADGGFIITWADNNSQVGEVDYGIFTIYAQRYDSEGNPLGTVTLNEIITNTPPSLTDFTMSDHTDMATVDENTYYEHNTSLHFNDVDADDTLTYSATLVPGWISIDSATGILSGTPLDADVGAIDIMVTATDVAVASVSDGYTLTVNDINNLPALVSDLPVSEVNEDSVFTYDLSSHFDDVDVGDVLAYSFADSYHYEWSSFSNGSWQEEDWLQINSDTGILTASPTTDNIEPYDPFKIGINVSDSESSITEYLYLRVNAVNDAPELSGTLIGSVTSGNNAIINGVLVGSDSDDTYVSVFDMGANYYHQWTTATEETNELNEYVLTIENVWGDSVVVTSAEDWLDLDNLTSSNINIPENYSATTSDGMWESQITVVNEDNTVITMESNFGKIVETKYPNGSYDLLQTGSTRIHWIDDVDLTTSYNIQDNTYKVQSTVATGPKCMMILAM